MTNHLPRHAHRLTLYPPQGHQNKPQPSTLRKDTNTMNTAHHLTDHDIRTELANLTETFTTQATDLLRQLDSPYTSTQTREAHLNALAATLDKAITAAYNERNPRDDQDFPTSIYHQ